MIIYAIGTVMLGLLASYKTWSAERFHAAAETYRKLANDVDGIWRTAHAKQQHEMLKANAAIRVVRDAMPDINAAAVRRDARAMYQRLAKAMDAMNTALKDDDDSHDLEHAQ